MNSNRVGTVAVGLALALSLAACGGEGAGGGAGSSGGGGGGSEEELSIGVAMPTQTSERWIADGKAVQEGLEKEGFDVELAYAGDDILTYAQQIDQMIN